MSCDALFEAVAAAVVRDRLDGFIPQNLANIVWAFAKAGQSDQKLFAAVARAAELRMSEFESQHIANTA